MSKMFHISNKLVSQMKILRSSKTEWPFKSSGNGFPFTPYLRRNMVSSLLFLPFRLPSDSLESASRNEDKKQRIRKEED